MPFPHPIRRIRTTVQTLKTALLTFHGTLLALIRAFDANTAAYITVLDELQAIRKSLTYLESAERADRHAAGRPPLREAH